MIKTHVTNSDLFLGQNAGDEIFKSIKNSQKSIKILSPYISPEYIDLLLAAKSRGVQILLLSGTDMAKGYKLERIYEKIIKQKRHLDEKAKNTQNKGRIALLVISVFLIAFNVMSFQNNYYQGLWSLATFVLIIPLLKMFQRKKIYNYTYNALFNFCLLLSPYDHKLADDHFFIHSKVYIIDDIVSYVGSVNFTKKGFRQNYECCVKITDEKAISEISDELKNLLHTEGLFYTDIYSIGQSIYPEPPN